MKNWSSLFVLLGAIPAFAADPANIAELKRAFAQPPDDARIMVRYWWFGPAVQKPEIERELRAMKEGGIGGIEVQTTYPLEVEGNHSFLSDQHLEALRFAGEKARELGLRMDLTLGSGWPYGGPHVALDQASARLRVARGPAVPTLAEGEKLIAKSERDGTALYFMASHTRQTVKRPAVGAEGWVLDHYSLPAIQNHIQKVGEPMLRALSKTPPYAIFSDSLEVYNADWTPNFLEEFRKRRGYDLTPYLTALAQDIGEQTRAIRHDWGKTLSELAEDNYLKPLRAWARQHGTRFRSQTYGIPPVTMSSSALADLPEGEGSQWRHFTATRWASSASHIYQRPVTSSETWTWLHSPVFRATPLDMKAEADLHFLQGVNQLIGHGWPYSPPEAGEPGWRFYAAAVLNDHNPWWIVMPDITRYLQRVSFLLRQGKPVSDVAVYLPTADAFAGFTLGRDSVNQAMEALIGPNVVPQILDAGYSFDFIDDGAIAQAGVPYRILILPGVERIPLATMEKIAELARKGVTVIATRRAPSLAPGLKESESDTPKIRELARGLRVLDDESKLGTALHAAVPRDLTAPPEIGFVHRKLDYADVYFLANTSNHAVHGDVSFRAAANTAGSWDAMTGEIWKDAGHLDLAPYESRVVVFSQDRPADRNSDRPAPGSSAPEFNAGWQVTFEGSTPVAMPALRSWTADESRKFYSGQATYERKFTFTGRGAVLHFGEGTPVTAEERRSGNGMRAMLESPVRDAAVVYVNNRRAGAVWCPPYELDITNFVHAGENALRIVVANTAVNLLAKGPLPDYKALTAKHGERFQAQDLNNLQPLPSGLLGPVSLTVR